MRRKKSTENRTHAEKSWTNRGFSPEFARLAVSYFQPKNEKEGTAVVVRWCDDGRFYVGANGNPGSRNDNIGSFFGNMSLKQIGIPEKASPSTLSRISNGIKVLFSNHMH